MTFKRTQALQIKSWLHLLLYECLRQFSMMLTQIMITGATLHPVQYQSTGIYTMRKDLAQILVAREEEPSTFSRNITVMAP